MIKIYSFHGPKIPFTIAKVTFLFLDNVFKLNGLPKSIVSNRESTFTSFFLRDLFKLQGVNLSYSSTYHPQSDGQTEIVNNCLEHFMKCFSGDKPLLWFDWFALVDCGTTSLFIHPPSSHLIKLSMVCVLPSYRHTYKG